MTRLGNRKRRLRAYFGKPKVPVTVEQLDAWITHGIRFVTRSDLAAGPVAVCEDPWDRVFVAELPKRYSRIKPGIFHAVSIEHIVALSGPSQARTRSWNSRFSNLGVASLPFRYKGELLRRGRVSRPATSPEPWAAPMLATTSMHDVLAGAWFGAFWVGTLAIAPGAPIQSPRALFGADNVRAFLASASNKHLLMNPGLAVRHVLSAIGFDRQSSGLDTTLTAEVAGRVMAKGINEAFDASSFEDHAWRREYELPAACVTVRIGMTLSTMIAEASIHEGTLREWQDALRSQVLPAVREGSSCPKRFIPGHPAFEDLVHALANVGEWLVQPDRPFVEKLITIRQMDPDKRLTPRQAIFAGAIYGAITGYPRTNRAIQDAVHRSDLASLAMATMALSDPTYTHGARLSPRVAPLVGQRRDATRAQAAGFGKKLPRQAPLPSGITHSRSRLFKP